MPHPRGSDHVQGRVPVGQRHLDAPRLASDPGEGPLTVLELLRRERAPRADPSRRSPPASGNCPHGSARDRARHSATSGSRSCMARSASTSAVSRRRCFSAFSAASSQAGSSAAAIACIMTAEQPASLAR